MRLFCSLLCNVYFIFEYIQYDYALHCTALHNTVQSTSVQFYVMLFKFVKLLFMYDIVYITNKNNCRIKVLKRTFTHPFVVAMVGVVVAAFGTIAFILISIIYMLVCHSGELLLFLERERKKYAMLFCSSLLFVLLFTFVLR